MAKPQATHGRPSGHESTDVRVGWVAFAAVALVAAAVLVHLMLWRYQQWATKGGATATPAPPTAGPGSAFNSVPLPRLQVSPPQDLNRFLEAERARLNSFGWVNRTAGIVHIPIERAMDLVTERGLPVRQNQAGGKTPLELLQERRNREAEAKEGTR